jgi:hypothetical protein
VGPIKDVRTKGFEAMHCGSGIKLKSADVRTLVKSPQIPQPPWIAIIDQTQMSDESENGDRRRVNKLKE